MQQAGPDGLSSDGSPGKSNDRLGPGKLVCGNCRAEKLMQTTPVDAPAKSGAHGGSIPPASTSGAPDNLHRIFAA